MSAVLRKVNKEPEETRKVKQYQFIFLGHTTHLISKFVILFLFSDLLLLITCFFKYRRILSVLVF